MFPEGCFILTLRMRKEILGEQPWPPRGGGRACISNPLLQMFQPECRSLRNLCKGGLPSPPPAPGLWSEAPPQAGSGGLSIPTVTCRAGWLGVREGGARREEGPEAFSIPSVPCCWVGQAMLEDVSGRWRRGHP